MAGVEVKEIPEFVVTPAKAIRRGNVTEPSHRTKSALDPAMILFDSVVKILAALVLHAVTEHCPNGPWVTVMPVRSHPRRGHAGDGSGGTEERLRGRHVTRLAEANIHQGARPIDRPIQVAPTPMNFDVGFINISGAADPPAPAAAKTIDQRRRELRLPLAYCVMTEFNATEEKHLGKIPQAQFVTQSPEHHERDDVGWIVGAVQNTTAPLVELLAARAATKAPVTPGGAFRPLRDHRSFTRDTPQ